MTTLTILRGLPGSGKSTWTAAHADRAAVDMEEVGLWLTDRHLI